MRQLLVLLGPPGVGKGTVARGLVSQYGFDWVSSGEVLRAEVKRGTELGEEIARRIDEGRFVSDELILQVMDSVVADGEEDQCLVLDGFPRTLTQAKQLDEWAGRGLAQPVRTVLLLEAPEEVLTERVLKRGAQSQRADDTLDKLQRRFSIYRREIAPLRQHYEAAGKLAKVDATGSPEVVLQRVCEQVQAAFPDLIRGDA